MGEVDNRFLLSFTMPKGIRLMGRDLYPWCVKYRVRLMAFKSPITDEDDRTRPITPADLLLAVQVCSETPIGTDGQLERDEVAKLSVEGEFASALNQFVDYLHLDKYPKFWENHRRSVGDKIGVPWPLSLVAFMISNGIPEKRAWEMPECQAVWMQTAFSVNAGNEVNLLTSDEEDFLDSLRDQDASQSLPEGQG